MKISHLKKLIKEIVNEIGDVNNLGKITKISDKPTLHLSHYANKLVPVSPDDKNLLDQEYTAGYGHEYTEQDLRGHDMESAEGMRYFTWQDIADLLNDFNVFITED